jgi:hypothetical protein
MSATELLDQLNRAGATLEIVDGQPRVRGAKISGELMAALKANRESVLAEFERRRLEDKDRYCRVPPPDAPQLARDASLPSAMQKVVLDYVMRQERPTHAWIMKRANEYHALGVAVDDCEWRACLDLIGWQRQTHVRGVVEFVSGINECAESLPSAGTPKDEVKL